MTNSEAQAVIREMLNNWNAFDARIRQLRKEAAKAGDRKMVQICRRALGEPAFSLYTQADARSECARVIADARAQRETTYGICYGAGPDTTIEECASLKVARERARQLTRTGQPSCDIVELEGAGPVLSSDGELIAPCHAPARTLQTISR